jgi:hypothetical protein
MTTTPRFERDLPMLLEDLYVAGTPDYRDDLVQRIAGTRQRPAWTFPERWLPMDVATTAVPTARMPWRQVGVLALIALLLAVAVIGIVGSQRRLPEPYGVAANGPLVYADGGDVFVRDSVDGASRLLVGGPDEEVWAMFSPRGDRLLVIRLMDGREHLFVGDPDGSDLIQVGRPYQGGDWVEFSPDGTMLAVQYDKNGVPAIELIMTDGSGTRPITELSAETPTFRPPDGRQILFRGYDPETGDWGLYLVDAAGGEPVRLAINGDGLEGGGYDLLYPVWSPTGDRLAYHSLVPLPQSLGRTNGFRLHLATIDAAGTRTGPIKRLEADPTADDEMNPLFSQDGRSLLYQQRFGLLGQTDYTDSAWTMSLDDTSARPLGVETSNGDGFWLSVAPDDTQVLVHLNREEEDWLVDLTDGSAERTDLASFSGAVWRREAP